MGKQFELQLCWVLSAINNVSMITWHGKPLLIFDYVYTLLIIIETSFFSSLRYDINMSFLRNTAERDKQNTTP